MKRGNFTRERWASTGKATKETPYPLVLGSFGAMFRAVGTRACGILQTYADTDRQDPILSSEQPPFGCSGWMWEGFHTALRKITTHIPIQDEAWLPSSFGHHRLCGGCGHFSTTLHFSSEDGEGCSPVSRRVHIVAYISRVRHGHSVRARGPPRLNLLKLGLRPWPQHSYGGQAAYSL